MKTRLIVVLAWLAINFAVPSFAQLKDAVDPKVVDQIRSLAMRYEEAFNKSDSAAVAALFKQDGVRVSHSGTFYGRPAIERSFAKDFHRWHTTDLFKRVDQVFVVGNEVRVHGIWSCTYHDNGYALTQPDEGHFSWVIVPEGDTCKIRRESNSESNFHATQDD
jgi:uncharacterized protein (TIGR02246 family)